MIFYRYRPKILFRSRLGVNIRFEFLADRFVLGLSKMSNVSERVKSWDDRWNAGHIGFHKTDVHPMLAKHFDKLMPDGKPNKIFFPLCGKAVDMKCIMVMLKQSTQDDDRLADKGFSVVGLDGVKKALEQFFTESGLEWTETDATQFGADAKLLTSKDDKIRLYCTDIMNFKGDVENTFDAVWDRGSLVALNREDVQQYAQTVKNLLKPGGRILVEVYEYDVSIMKDEEEPKPPPPHPVYEDEIRKLYEPDCTVEAIDRDWRELRGKDIRVAVYLVTKK